MDSKIKRDLIRNLISEMYASEQKFCEHNSVSVMELKKILAGSLDVDLRDIFKIAWGLGLQVSEIFKD